MRRSIQTLMPFVILGVIIVILAFSVVLLAYILFFGAVIGLIFFAINWIRNKFFTPKLPAKPRKKSGRIIDSDDWKEL